MLKRWGGNAPFLQANFDFGAAQHCDLLHGKRKSGVSLAEIDSGDYIPRGNRTFEKAMEFCWLVDEKLDHYMTFNSVRPYKERCVENVNYLNGHFVDLDFYNHNLSFNDVVTSARSICEELKLPMPTKIITSGRGAYLLWLFKKPVYVGSKLDDVDKSKRMAAWQLTQNLLINSFESLGSDQACKDASRILRISGSINSKSSSRVTLFDCGDEVSLSSFKSCVKNSPVKTTEPFQLRTTVNSFYSHSKRYNQQHTTASSSYSYSKLATLMWARMNDLNKLAELRGGRLADHRAMSIFYYAMSVSMASGSTESLLRSVSNFMRQCVVCDSKYNPDAPERLLTTVIQRHLKKEAVRAVRGDFYNIQYRARNETIIANLAITEDEQRHLSTLIGKEEKYRRKNEARNSKRHANGGVSRKEYEANAKAKADRAKELKAMGMKAKQIALELDVSIHSVYGWSKN